MKVLGRFGRNELPEDPRDYPVAPLLERTAATSRYWTMGGHDLRLDQGRTGTCEGNAWTEILIDGPTTHSAFVDFATASTAEAFARQLYVDATGDTTLQEGAHTRQVLDELLGRGQIASYHKCASVDEVIQTLLAHGPVGFALPWFSSMDDVSTEYDNSYLKVYPDSGIRGYHEIALTGVNTSPPVGPPYARLQNSWGQSWGHNGTARVLLFDLDALWLNDAYTVAEVTF